MDSLTNSNRSNIRHVAAIPYPGRGHINPMMNLCKQLVSKTDNIHVTFIVTQEWHGVLESEPKLDRIELRSIPNVTPSEKIRANNMPEFFEALWTRMEAPVEEVIDRLEVPVTMIIFDAFLGWVVEVGRRRNVAVASLWTMSANFFSQYHHFDLFVQNGHYPANLSECGKERVNYIPGVSSMRIVDLNPHLEGKNMTILKRIRQTFSLLHKAQYILIVTVDELEPETMEALQNSFPIPVYSVGPFIRYSEVGDSKITNNDFVAQLKWLDCQPNGSVLYVSFGSFLSVSSSQLDEIASGLHESGIRFLWVARGEASSVKELCGDRGLVVPWCDQLKVLKHSSVGGYLTHCGWNSIQEGLFAGLPFLVFPLAIDQFTNAKKVVQDWKVGWRMKENPRSERLVTSKEIAESLKKFMDMDNNEAKEIRARAKELQQIVERAVAEDGSSQININSIIKTISFAGQQ